MDQVHILGSWYGGIDLSPGDIVLDGDPAPTERGTAALPHFTAIALARLPILGTVTLLLEKLHNFDLRKEVCMLQ